MDFKETLSKIQRLMGVSDTENGANILEEGAIKDYLKNNEGNVNQFVINWCLVHYCFLVGRTRTLNHWRDELCTQMNKCADVEFPNNKYSKRYAKFKEIFINELKLDNPQKIINIIYKKFYEIEHFEKDTKLLNNLVFDFCNNLAQIIDILAIGNFQKINEYGRTLR